MKRLAFPLLGIVFSTLVFLPIVRAEDTPQQGVRMTVYNGFQDPNYQPWVEPPTGEPCFDAVVPKPDWKQDTVALSYAAVSVAYVLLIFIIGYYSASFLFLFAMALMARVTRKLAVVLSAVVTLPLIYVGFEVLLRTRLPRGMFF